MIRNGLLNAMVGLGLCLCIGCQNSDQDLVKMKQELKREILAELRQESPLFAQTVGASVSKDIPEQTREAMKAEIEREVLAKMQSQMKKHDQGMSETPRDSGAQSAQRQPSPTGSAQGYVRHNGRGLQACHVKLVRIFKGRGVLTMVHAVKEGVEFVTVTDDQGWYIFDTLPVGSYKLSWQLPNDRGWIRRLRDKPDAIITDGENTDILSVETARGLVSQ